MSRKKGDNNSLIELAFPKTALKHIVTKHKLHNETRISEEGLKQLSEILDELSGWIILESEKLATYEGKSTITSKQIREAVKIYFGKRD